MKIFSNSVAFKSNAAGSARSRTLLQVVGTIAIVALGLSLPGIGHSKAAKQDKPITIYARKPPVYSLVVDGEAVAFKKKLKLRLLSNSHDIRFESMLSAFVGAKDIVEEMRVCEIHFEGEAGAKYDIEVSMPSLTRSVPYATYTLLSRTDIDPRTGERSTVSYKIPTTGYKRQTEHPSLDARIVQRKSKKIVGSCRATFLKGP